MLRGQEDIELHQARQQVAEALEQQTATAEILKVISGSAQNLDPVFRTILWNATRLCQASVGAVFLFDGESLTNVAHHNASSEFAEFLNRSRPRPSRETTTRRCALERRTAHTADLMNDPEYSPSEFQRRENVRSVLSVPMMRDGALIGVITLWRRVAVPFSVREISLIESFADQAAIAIENVRLFKELQARNAELSELLEQQTATNEILRAIGSSHARLEPVFGVMLKSALRFCDARHGILFLREGDALVLAAQENTSPAYAQHYQAQPKMYPAPDRGPTSRAALERSVVHVLDLQTDPSFRLPPHLRSEGLRTALAVPILQDDTLYGVITVFRMEVLAFSESQINLLNTFADQAVIAIRNSRLFSEIQEQGRQLEIASRHKSEFLANMSHELRTPLNAIIGFARIVMRRSREQIEPKQYENLEKILSSGQHLLALINSVLDLAKVEAGRVDINPAEIELSTTLEHCARTIEPLIDANAVTLVKAFDSALPRMYVDEEKLRQIVLNLLSNAAKFTTRGSIRLQAQVSNQSVAVSVADTGIGIAPDKLEAIFEEFSQVDARSTRAHGGTGLGLTIARRLARLMGGDIIAESELGGGSKFTLMLPLRYRSPDA